MVLLAQDRLSFDTVLVNIFYEEKCHHTMLDCFDLDELVNIYLMMKLQLGLFVDLA